MFELLVVQIEVDKIQIRVMAGYGPQENLDTDKRMPMFFSFGGGDCEGKSSQ